MSDELKEKIKDVLSDRDPQPRRRPVYTFMYSGFINRKIIYKGIALTVVVIAAFLAILYYGIKLYQVFNSSPVTAEPNTTNQIPKSDKKTQKGEITYPFDGIRTDRMIEIEGYTENLPPDLPYVWLVVDVPAVGLCWPKGACLRPNSRFSCTILENGSNKNYIVSLYAVDEKINAQIKNWFLIEVETGNFAGFTMIPEKYKLDSVRLTLERA